MPKPEHHTGSGGGNSGGGSYAGGHHYGGYGGGASGGASHGNWNVDRTQMFNERDFWVKQKMAQHAG